MTHALPPICDFSDCDQAATSRYLHTAHKNAVEFGVCSTHFARISGGERPVIGTQHTESADPDARPTLFLA